LVVEPSGRELCYNRRATATNSRNQPKILKHTPATPATCKQFRQSRPVSCPAGSLFTAVIVSSTAVIERVDDGQAHHRCRGWT
jgi:hypothetical protein